jgi:hypothetical protein
MSDPQPGSVCIPRYDQPPPPGLTADQRLAWLNYEYTPPAVSEEADDAD